MSEAAEETGSEAPLANRERFLSAYRSAQRRAAESGTPLGEDPLVPGQDEFRRPPLPYPGLRSFNAREGNIFFGRERNVRDIRDRLANNRIVVVLGGSGSGKSSVIRAGLMPRLTSTMAVKQRSGNWYTAEFRPRLNPVGELAAALAELVRREFPEQQPDRPEGIERGAAGAESELRQAVLARIRADLQVGPEDQKPLEVSTEPQDRISRADMLCDGLFDFVDNELDRRDAFATREYRSGRPSLLLLIDQFEEVFRPEVPIAEAGGRQDLLDMIIAARARLANQPGVEAENQSGLFIAITMRSEELHRCAEHPSLGVADDAVPQQSLTDLVNRSSYLLDLLDPEQDRGELTDAIVQPARRVFRDWGVPFDPNGDDAPFEDGVVKWLLNGADRLSQTLEHRADQLPLLQHALQTMWHRAVEEWEGAVATPLLICRRHLDAKAADGEGWSADLVACLDSRANEASKRAIERYVDVVKPKATETAEVTVSSAQAQSRAAATLASLRRRIESHLPGTRDPSAEADEKYKSSGVAVLRAAFRSLARRDDRGSWVRRFADLTRVEQFIDADPEVTAPDPDGSEVAPAQRQTAARAALREFIAAGYLTGGHGRPYDISHEALIRNWQHFQLWLFEPEESAQALVQMANLLPRYRPEDFISFQQARSVEFARERLPENWPKEQIGPVLNRPDVREQWRRLLDTNDERRFPDDVLEYIYFACQTADYERYKQFEDAYWRRRLEQTRKFWMTAVAALAIVLLVTWAGLAMYLARKYLGLKF